MEVLKILQRLDFNFQVLYVCFFPLDDQGFRGLALFAGENIDAREGIFCRDTHLGLVPAILAFHDARGAGNVNLDPRQHRRAVGDHLEALLQVVVDDERELPDLQVNVLDALGVVFFSGVDTDIGDLLGEPEFVHVKYQAFKTVKIFYESLPNEDQSCARRARLSFGWHILTSA